MKTVQIRNMEKHIRNKRKVKGRIYHLSPLAYHLFRSIKCCKHNSFNLHSLRLNLACEINDFRPLLNFDEYLFAV